MTNTIEHERRTSFASVARSFAAKIVALILVFLAVPVILYGEFREADQNRRDLLQQSLRTQGHLIAEALRPFLESFDGASADALNGALNRLAEGNLKIRLLLRPEDTAGDQGFFYIAAVPLVSPEDLERERGELMASGVLDQLGYTCEGNQALSLQYERPGQQEEILTSVTPQQSSLGCWVVITSSTAAQLLAVAVERPYWKEAEGYPAAGIYALLAIFALLLFVTTWSNLRRFVHLARAIRSGREERGTFASLNHLPELSFVAEEFDRLVRTLRGTASAIRDAAEENAHAFKAPIAVIAQSVEALGRGLPNVDSEGRRSLELVERSVERLDSLVSAARRMDELAAQSLEPALTPLDLSGLLERICNGYAESFVTGGLRLECDITAGLSVQGDEEMIETLVENLLDNAFDHSPESGRVLLSLASDGKAWVRLAVSDEGPGVESAKLEKIFDRYESTRPQNGAGETQHFGLGLWIVRRNAETLGGSVKAENRRPRGLTVTLTLPRSR
jgi:two-component system sensor histidine kinase ChvG